MEFIGRYRKIRRLGAGGQGQVFLVQDPLDAHGRHLALKKLEGQNANHMAASILREFSALAAIALPGIPTVLDFGMTPPEEGSTEWTPYFTRAYVEGRDLNELYAECTRDERVKLFCQVLDTVGPLHRVGVIHGDLKPSNILVTATRQCQVIDFGLARLRSDGRKEGGAGSPAFMAPEIVVGGSSTSRSDVFALCGMLYEAYCGAKTFDARDVSEEKFQAIDSSVRAVIERGLQPNPEERYPDAAEMRLALRTSLGMDDKRAAATDFVPPRPLGFEALIAELEARVTAAPAALVDQAPILLLNGQAGGGKSTVLRETKWRLQARGALVLELPARTGNSTATYGHLLAQLPDMASRAEPSTAPRLEFLLSRLSAAAEGGLVVIMADDVQYMPPDTVALLNRLPVVSSQLRVLASTDRLATTELEADHIVAMEPLDRDVVCTLSQQVLGPIDAAVVDALHEVSHGRPSTLVGALRALSWRRAPSAEDVRSLPLDDLRLTDAGQRFSSLDAVERSMVELLCLATAPVPTATIAKLIPESGTRLAEMVYARLIREQDSGCILEDRAVREVALRTLEERQLRETAQKLLSTLEPPQDLLAAQLTIRLGIQDANPSLILKAAEKSAEDGAPREALHLLSTLPADLCAQRRAELHHELSEYAAAREAALSLCEEESTASIGRVLAARALVAAGEYEEAKQELAAIPADAPPFISGLAARARARMHMRRGAYDEAIREADASLELLPPGAHERVESLTTRGMCLEYTGDSAAAWRGFSDALKLAQECERASACTNVIAYMGIAKQRAGDLDAARAHYADCLERARMLGDAGSVATFSLNLGGVLLSQMEYAEAEKHIRVGLRVARRVGKRTTSTLAQANLAYLCTQTGRYEEASRLAAEARSQSMAEGFAMVAAMAAQVLGEVAARRYDIDEALLNWEAAALEYQQLAQAHEALDVELDIISALVDVGRGEDALVRMSALDRHVVDGAERKLTLRYSLLRARLLLTEGSDTEARALFRTLIPDLQSAEYTELRWEALHGLATVEARLGEEGDARLLHLQALEVLEAQAARLPTDVRTAFWQDARRQAVRNQVSGQRGTRHFTAGPDKDTTDSGSGMKLQEAMRLLEITKRLANEHDVERLLTVITDAAVQLSGAERGFVLTVNAQGQLEPFLVRHGGITPDDPHVAFSRSIADAVLIDGQPLVTVDASEDHRLSEYISVHQMMLKSVVALPIRGRAGILGVLYLEHRMRRGRFAEVELDLLVAFADQSAIAIENARLLAEAKRQHRELEEAHSALSDAKAEIERVLSARTEELQDLKREVASKRESGPGAAYGIIGQSAATRAIIELIRRVCRVQVPVVIHGESGTGKELVARAIHFSGPRANQKFLALNCAAVPEQLIESTLFGHLKGSFTGADRDHPGVMEQASGGTLFLDEVGDMPMKMQIDLLRVLQDGRVRRLGSESEVEVDVRIVSASNKSLQEEVRAGNFREDLFYRLHVVEIKLPPLRERRDDIPLLVAHFLKKHATSNNTPLRRLDRDAIAHLRQHALPGNVRQLEHILLNALIMAPGDEISASDLPDWHDAADPVGVQKGDPILSAGSQETAVSNLQGHKEREREMIIRALEANDWNRAQAARALGIPRRTFYRRLREHEIL